MDYHPTKRIVLFGHHFAAIAGPGPLIGPVLAAQWGYFPGFAWIVIGACLAGGVHDFVILVASVRQDGLTLPKIARNMIGPVAGITTAIATLFIVIAVLASVAIVVVKALSHSSWGMFTILVTIPAALLTGAVDVQDPARASGRGLGHRRDDRDAGRDPGQAVRRLGAGATCLIFSEQTLSIMLPIYAAIASILPVWVLMCPRDYLSSYMKIGVIVVLAVGIFVAQPTLKMPATTPFLGGGGPVVSGAVWPFVCIVIMCGALSGFHALIASGTTPKMINKESDIRPIGYGAMILEGFVALTALVAACALGAGRLLPHQHAADTADEQPIRRRSWLQAADRAPVGPGARVEFRCVGGGRRGEARRPDRRRGDAGGGHGQGLLQPARHEAPDGLLVSLRHHVRGPVHPHAAGDRHARGPVRVPGDAGPVQPGMTLGHQPNWGSERRR